MTRQALIFQDGALRYRVKGNEADLAAFASDFEMQYTRARLHVPDFDETQFLAADAVTEQGGEDRTIPHALQRVWGRVSSSLRA